MDGTMTRPKWTLHALLMGVLHRYLDVLNLGLETMKSGSSEFEDTQRFYQQESDVCMLRLFDSFGESAPQIVFHLYVMVIHSKWPLEQALWTGMSATASVVSLAYGIAAYRYVFLKGIL